MPGTKPVVIFNLKTAEFKIILTNYLFNFSNKYQVTVFYEKKIDLTKICICNTIS